MPNPKINGDLIWALNVWRESANADSQTKRAASDNLCGALEKWVQSVIDDIKPAECCGGGCCEKKEETPLPEEITIMVDDLTQVEDLAKKEEFKEGSI